VRERERERDVTWGKEREEETRRERERGGWRNWIEIARQQIAAIPSL